jgi:transposase InsO family protein
MLITEDRMEISVLARHGSQRRRRLLSPPRRRGRPHHDRYGSCYKSRAGAEAAGCSGSSTSAQGPIRRKPTARPTASSRTALREWAYATAFNTSEQRRAELPLWLHRYNWHRPHASVAGKPPISRLPITGNNLLTLHI